MTPEFYGTMMTRDFRWHKALLVTDPQLKQRWPIPLLRRTLRVEQEVNKVPKNSATVTTSKQISEHLKR